MGGLAISDGLSGPRRTHLDQLVISVAGPLAGFFLAAIVVGAVWLGGGKVLPTLDQGLTFWKVTGIANENLDYLVHITLWINIFWGLINLMPVFPLDGGQIARALFSMYHPSKGLVWSLWLSVIVAGAMAIGWGLRGGDLFILLLFASLGINNFMMLKQMYGPYGGGGIQRPFGDGGRDDERPWRRRN